MQTDDRPCFATDDAPDSVRLAEEPPHSSDPPPRKLLDRVRWNLRVKHYSIRTEQAYVNWIRRYILFHKKRHPDVMAPIAGQLVFADMLPARWRFENWPLWSQIPFGMIGLLYAIADVWFLVRPPGKPERRKEQPTV